jgi:hypothetical protein
MRRIFSLISIGLIVLSAVSLSLPLVVSAETIWRFEGTTIDFIVYKWMNNYESLPPTNFTGDLIYESAIVNTGTNPGLDLLKEVTVGSFVFDTPGDLTLINQNTLGIDFIPSGNFYSIVVNKDGSLYSNGEGEQLIYLQNTGMDYMTLNVYSGGVLLIHIYGEITNVTEINPVPEPSLMVLLGISVMSLAGLRRWWKE